MDEFGMSDGNVPKGPIVEYASAQEKLSSGNLWRALVAFGCAGVSTFGPYWDWKHGYDAYFYNEGFYGMIQDASVGSALIGLFFGVVVIVRSRGRNTPATSVGPRRIAAVAVALAIVTLGMNVLAPSIAN